MLDTAIVIKLLPALRRYARAICIDAAKGDAAVEAMVESLLKLEAPETDESTEVRVFSLLDQQLRTMQTEGATLPRRALLLTAMEEFSADSAARILDIPLSDLPGLLTTAENDLKRSLATDVLIIEDEVLIARHIGKIVQDLGHTVCGYASTRSEALAKARQMSPGLVLADVKLADGSLGYEAVADILGFLPDLPVIYITAYPNLLLTGEKPQPDFLIPKPFRAEYVQAVISQSLLRLGKAA